MSVHISTSQISFSLSPCFCREITSNCEAANPIANYGDRACDERRAIATEKSCSPTLTAGRETVLLALPDIPSSSPFMQQLRRMKLKFLTPDYDIKWKLKAFARACLLSSSQHGHVCRWSLFMLSVDDERLPSCCKGEMQHAAPCVAIVKRAVLWKFYCTKFSLFSPLQENKFFSGAINCNCFSLHINLSSFVGQCCDFFFSFSSVLWYPCGMEKERVYYINWSEQHISRFSLRNSAITTRCPGRVRKSMWIEWAQHARARKWSFVSYWQTTKEMRAKLQLQMRLVQRLFLIDRLVVNFICATCEAVRGSIWWALDIAFISLVNW